jgi:hypothetical protein
MTQIKPARTFHRFPDGAQTEGTLDLKMYFPEELQALCYGGLRQVTAYE